MAIFRSPPTAGALLFHLVKLCEKTSPILTYLTRRQPTLQQLREVVTEEVSLGYLIHDRDRIFSKHLDDSIGRAEPSGRASARSG